MLHDPALIEICEVDFCRINPVLIEIDVVDFCRINPALIANYVVDFCRIKMGGVGVKDGRKEV